jgi:integrase
MLSYSLNTGTLTGDFNPISSRPCRAYTKASASLPKKWKRARKVVVKIGEMVGIELRPHDLRRHADLSTTQRYLGKVSDYEAIRWIENLHG